MFNDLSNQELNKIPILDAKAYPSVNSPNDGGFNSEENMRWITKMLTTKPFIVGQTDEAVNNAFKSLGAAGNGVYTASGMFSVDGYVFKLAQTPHISFDDTSTERLITNNTQNIQRFVNELTNQGTESVIETDLANILYSEYNPNNQEIDVQEAWTDAYENNKCIGYICNVYKNSYLDSITLEPSISPITATFENTTIPIIGESLPSGSIPAWVKTLIEGSIVEDGETFSQYSDNTLYVYYPIFFKDIKIWNSETSKYNKKQQIYFVDIYGLTYIYGIQVCNSRQYPVTHNVYADIDSNAPLDVFSNPSFTNSDCKKTTIPTTLYDFESLYDSSSVRYNNTNFSGWSTVGFSFSNVLSSLFDKKSISNLLGLIPSTSESSTNIPYIRNTLSYYCLKDIDSTKLLKVTVGGESKDVPVAFMTSEGSLCSDGFIYTDTTKMGAQTYNRYPVEGYVHFAKRLYLMDVRSMSSPTESSIQEVTIEQMCAASSWFTNFYNTYLAAPMSVYIHMAYCSLYDNVVLSFGGYASDYSSIKSAGCGKRLYDLEQGSGVTQDDNEFYSYQTYQYTAYKRDVNNALASESRETTVTYHCDITSDKCKFNGCVYGTPSVVTTAPNIAYYTKPSDFIDKLPIYIDDPINYYKKCSTNTQKSTTVAGITLYKITNSGTYYSAISKVITNQNGYVGNLNIDKFLAPTIINEAHGATPTPDTNLCATLATHLMISLANASQESSVGNGMCLSWKQNCWSTEIPYILNINKDNLGYLRAYDLFDTDYYKGVSFSYQFPQDVTVDDLFLYNLIISTTPIIGGFDIETCTRDHDTTSEYSKRRREAFMHFNKIYGDNFCSLDDEIMKIVDENIHNITEVKQLEASVDSLNTNVGEWDEELGTISDVISNTVVPEITNMKNNGLRRVYHDYICIDSLTPTIEGVTQIDANSSITYIIDIDTTIPLYVGRPYCIAQQVVDNMTSFYSSDLKIDTYHNPNLKTMNIVLTNTSSSAITDILVHYMLVDGYLNASQ